MHVRAISPIHLSRLVLAGAAAILFVAAFDRAHTKSTMTAVTQDFMKSLNADQKAQISFKFEDEERFHWDYRPVPRKGLPLREMSAFQKHLAHAMMSAGLSQSGFIKASTIMSLEDVLREIEKDSGERRNPEKYYFSVYGEPSDDGTWAFKVDGHHLSLNYTFVKGQMVAAPTFFGSNPYETRVGPRKGLRPLHREEDIGRELYDALTAEQRKTAVVAEVAYDDIITNSFKDTKKMEGQPNGLPVGKLNAKQRAIFDQLVAEYANNMPPDLAAERLDRVKKAGNQTHFAWAGGGAKGDKHYYRVSGPGFLIEYNNTQNDANHVHSVWRDYDGDWGWNLLKSPK